MIDSTLPEFTSSGSKEFRSSPSSHHAHQRRAVHHSPRVLTSSWSPSFAEPEISSLWDTGLLDRLTLPLTRYHE